MAISQRRFYRTVLKVEVLSEEPLPNEVYIYDVLRREQAGDVSVYVSDQQRDETDAKAMVMLLKAHGNDAGFFNLNAKGEDRVG